MLQALGLPPTAINSFVLEMDPVPRALLSVDPTFQLFTVSFMPPRSSEFIITATEFITSY